MFDRRPDDQREIDYCLNCTIPAHLCKGSCGGELVKKRKFIIALRSNLSGKIEFRGTYQECADYVGMGYKSFVDAMRKRGRTKEYNIERLAV